jgi:hypothetical protein
MRHSRPRRRITGSARNQTFTPKFCTRRPPGSPQLVEQRLCLFEVGRIETLGEPVVDRCEKVMGVGAATLVAAEPGEARGGAQFPELGVLFLGDVKGLAIQFLGGLGIPCSSSNSPLCRISSASNQRPPVLLTISNASSNRFRPSSTCPAISLAAVRRAIWWGIQSSAPVAR